ncbi:GNAT family N-acetyltransferase [Clostridiaceae bacterium M8S5]|nr:GNAT family N-acetyltransferase [Clostridiaceae bacterium M8S5]
MIYKLDKNDYSNHINLLDGIKNFPEVYSVIAGNNPGEIYVNSKENPRSALLWNQGMQGFYFIGDHKCKVFTDDIKVYMNQILMELTKKNINWFEISGVTDQWHKIIEDVFKDRCIKYGVQLAYLFEHGFSNNMDCENSRDIRKVNEDIYGLDVTNIEFIINELQLFWGSIDNFFENKGICFYAVEDKQIVSICYTGFRHNSIHTIGIETLKEYRRKGYAIALAKCFIKECNKNKFIPYWDCSEDNDGSRILAEKLGFGISSKYRCYWFNF